MKRIYLALVIVSLLVVPDSGHSKTVAYMFTPENVYKFDTDIDAILSKVTAPHHIMGFLDEEGHGSAVDVANKILLSGYDGRESGFYVYDIQTLKEIKDVSFPDMVKQVISLTIIYPPKGAKFYIQVHHAPIVDGELIEEQEGIVNLAYDKKTQEFLGVADSILSLSREKIWSSEDQNTIYVGTVDDNIRVYESQTLKLLNTINLSSAFSQSVWGKDIDDIKNGSVLLGENNKLQKIDKEKYSFRIYKIADGTKTPKFELPDIGSMDQALLVPNSNKAVFNDVQYAPTTLPFPPKGTVSFTAIHIYDVNSGTKLGMVPLDSKYGGKILGIRPSGDKLYYYTHADDKISVVDLNAYKVIKQIEIPEVRFMVIFEE